MNYPDEHNGVPCIHEYYLDGANPSEVWYYYDDPADPDSLVVLDERAC